MRYSRLFGRTLKEKPSEADSVSHQLLLRASMVQQVATGVYSYLPIGWRVLKKIEQIIREEMDKAGCQELMMPTLQPFELCYLMYNVHLPVLIKRNYQLSHIQYHQLLYQILYFLYYHHLY